MTVIESPAFDLLYEAQVLGTPERFVGRMDGSGARTRLMPGVYAADPAITNDGTRIAFVGRDANGNLDIYVASRNGTNVQRLTNDAAVDDQPSWSPDGTKLVFRREQGGMTDIWMMNADGSGQRNLTESLFMIAVPADTRPSLPTAAGSRCSATTRTAASRRISRARTPRRSRSSRSWVRSTPCG